MNLTKGYLRLNKAPERLIYFITTRCNSKCKHCFYWKNLNTGMEELTLKELDQVAKSLGPMYEVFISGGEPFLRQDIDKVCEIFFKRCKLKSINIPTNCLLKEKIDEKVKSILKRCPGMRLSIGVSLDGLEKTNDYIRGVKGHFNAAIERAKALSKIRSKRLDVYFVSTVTNKNVKEIYELAKLVKKETGLNMNIEPMRGSPMDKSMLAPNHEEYNELLKKIYGLREKPGKGIMNKLSERKSKYNNKVAVHVLKNDALPFQCKAGSKIAVLEPNGDVRLCELTDIVGNLKDYNLNFKKLWKNPKAEAMRKKIKGCYCTHGCFISTSLKYSPKELARCLITKDVY